MSFGHALYYPYIDLTNKNWLKYAFLFWDKITRIVPFSVSPSDTEDIIKIRYETNFIEDFSPDRGTVSNTFHLFSEFLDEFIESKELYNHYRKREKYDDWQIENRNRRRFQEDREFRREYIEAITKSRGTYLHIQKLDTRLKNKLFDLGLAIPGKNEWEDWVRIDNQIGLTYMTYLAKEISRQKSLPVVTDLEQFHSLSSSFDQKMTRDYNSEFEYKLGNLLISSFVPKDINTVPFDKLIEIRQKYSAERLAYFNNISELCQTIQTIDNESALNDALNHYKSSLSNQTEELKKAFEANRIETVSKFINISVPSTLLSLSANLPIEYKSLGVGVGLLFGLVTSLNSVTKDRNELRQKPLSYLLNINSELSGGGLLQKINDGVKGIRRW